MNRKLTGMLSAVALFTVAGTVNATVFSIDDFKVTKNTETYFHDTFSNGLAPKNLNNENPAQVDLNPTDRAYITNPYTNLPGPEVDGKLELDTAVGLINLSPVNNLANRHHAARVNSSQIDDEASLREDDLISVEALFDLTVPGLLSERFGVRLTDWTVSSNNEGIEMVLAQRADGNIRLLFRQADFVTNSFTTIQGWNPVFPGSNFNEYEQIALSIFNDNLNKKMFKASFTLFDNDDIYADVTRTSSNEGQMFQVSDWVRPEFFANHTFSVPEPSTLALLGLGLAGFGYRRKLK